MFRFAIYAAAAFDTLTPLLITPMIDAMLIFCHAMPHIDSACHYCYDAITLCRLRRFDAAAYAIFDIEIAAYFTLPPPLHSR